jgi:drug/metabolite transporter (DMT)-like permease
MAYTLGIILKRSAPSRNEALGLLLGLVAGCILLKIWNSFHILVESGNLYFLLAAFSWAVMSKFTSRASSYGSSLSFSLWQYLITLLCLLPFVNIMEARQIVEINNKLSLTSNTGINRK